jgi:CelD/BcsL family acetyltransferase involved in cellulose biosynthesis
MKPNAYVEIPADVSDLQKLPVNARLRTRLRSIHRELVEKGELRLQCFSQADQQVLHRFYGLEASGWKGAAGSAIACSAETRQFYDAIAKSAERYGYLCLYTLELGGQLLAAHFGLSYKGTYFSPKVAYNEKFKQWAPGHLIVESILRDCVFRNVHGYDITGPNDEWKAKWATQTHPQNIQYIFRNGLGGNLAYSLCFRLRPWVKRMLRERGGKRRPFYPRIRSTIDC